MNPLHAKDIFENLLVSIVHPMDIEGYQLGSDPVTHKKMRENVNKGSNTGESSSSSGASSSTSDQSASDNKSNTEESTSNKMDETKDSKDTSTSGK